MKKLWGSRPLAVLLIGCFIHFMPIIAFGGKAPQLSVNIRFDNSNVRAKTTQQRAMEILLQAPDYESRMDDVASPPMNIALVIDRSGSMAGKGKMQYAKDAARSIIQRLGSRDAVALISFDDQAEVVIPMQSVRKKSYLIDRINMLEPRGGTNLGAGLMAGYREIEKQRRPKSINRVILLSDGLANQGITSVSELSRITAGNYQEGVSLSTLGVGYSFNEDLMSSLAIEGGGWYYYIDRPSDIPDIMAREFSTMQCLVASNIRIRIKLSADININKVIGNRYEKRGRTVEYNVGELSAGERRRYMVHLDIPEMMAGEHIIGEVYINYVIPGNDTLKVVKRPITLYAARSKKRMDQGKNHEVIERSYIFEVNEAKKQAALAVDSGNMPNALKILARVEDRLNGAPIKTDRLAREKSSIMEYAAAIRSRPQGGKLRSLQKAVKHRTYALEGC